MTLWLSHATCSYICMYINAVANSVTRVCYTYNMIFITQFLKSNINYIYSLRVSPPPPSSQRKILGAHLYWPVADVALLMVQIFFRKIPALTWASRDVRVTVGMNRCIQIQATSHLAWPWVDRELTVTGPWADFELTVSVSIVSNRIRAVGKTTQITRQGCCLRISGSVCLRATRINICRTVFEA
jgi:hypothetical protein